MEPAHKPVYEEAEGEPNRLGGVDPALQPAHGGAEHGRDEVVQSKLGKPAVKEKRGDGNEEAERECEDDPLVHSPDAEHLPREGTECDSLV